ncbi:TOMM precursor leader peptide-binding protein [Janibacter alittae]|uniref:TOMM leader peptide-binding protein n=1 Tax=Janibacter alittae TaxID=3115209 RepID=A0ABZ2MJG1_9MICO
MQHPGTTPHLRPLRRPDGSVQIGLGVRSVRLQGLTDGECRWLSGVDPTRALTEAVSTAALEGIDPGRATRILDRLVTGDLVHPGPTGELPRVAVVGSGALPALLVDGLRQSERVLTTRVRPGGEGGSTNLAVVVSATPPAPDSVRPWLVARTPVLPVWCLPEQASIGPLLLPDDGPCLQCLDLTRAETDPGWPWLSAQLSRPGITGTEPVNGLPAVRLLAAGLTTTLVLDHVDRRLTTRGWSFEVATPGPTLERHPWATHPGCSRCTPPPLQVVPTPTDEGGSSTDTGRNDTMAG